VEPSFVTVRPNFAENYASKTDGELLALAGESTSLDLDARLALWQELDRRKISPSRFRPSGAVSNEEIPGANPAFNIPAMIAASALALALVGLLLRVAFEFAHEGHLFVVVLVGLLLWGPIFGAIAWATRRALRNNSIGRTRK
jgi:hypothetical protein